MRIHYYIKNINQLLLIITRDNIVVTTQFETNHDLYYKWSPKSHMRDWEVMDPWTKYKTHIAKGQGIGVIICEFLEFYIKLYFSYV